MKKNIVIFIIFLLPFYLFSQSGNFLNNKPKTSFFNENYLKNNLLLKDTLYKKNLFCIDIPFITFSYTRNIKNSKWYLGGGFGLYGDYILQKYEIKNAYDFNTKHKFPLYEFLHISIQSNYVISKNVILRTGITLQPLYTMDEGMEGVAFTGLYFSPLFGLKHFKIGTRFLIGLVDPFSGDDLNPLIYYNPLIFFSFNL